MRISKSMRLKEEIIQAVETQAQQENRSFSNVVETVLEQAVMVEKDADGKNEEPTTAQRKE